MVVSAARRTTTTTGTPRSSRCSMRAAGNSSRPRGKEGILHVVDRDDGKLVFKLPMTTMLNHDAPLTPEGVRVCPVAGVQWNGAAHSPTTDLLYVNAIDWCTVFKVGPRSEVGRDGALHGTRQRLGHQRSDQTNGRAGSTRSIRKPARWRGASTRRRRCTRRSRRPRATCCSPAISAAISSPSTHATARTLYRFDTGGPIAGGVVTYETEGQAVRRRRLGQQRRLDPAAPAARPSSSSGCSRRQRRAARRARSLEA